MTVETAHRGADHEHLANRVISHLWPLLLARRVFSARLSNEGGV